MDGSGNVYVGGYSTGTWGTPLRAYSGSLDAFAVKLNSSGGLTWNTFLGGSGIDRITDLALDGAGNLLASGDSTAGWGTPDRAYSALRDAFAAVLTSGGALSSHGFLGGAGDDYAEAIAGGCGR